MNCISIIRSCVCIIYVPVFTTTLFKKDFRCFKQIAQEEWRTKDVFILIFDTPLFTAIKGQSVQRTNTNQLNALFDGIFTSFSSAIATESLIQRCQLF